MESSGTTPAEEGQALRRSLRLAQAVQRQDPQSAESSGCGASPSHDSEAFDSDLATGATSRGRKEQELPEGVVAAPEASDAGSPEDAGDWKKPVAMLADKFAMMTDRMDMLMTLVRDLDARMHAGTPSHLASEDDEDPQPLPMRVPATRQRNDFSESDESDEDLRIRDESRKRKKKKKKRREHRHQGVERIDFKSISKLTRSASADARTRFLTTIASVWFKHRETIRAADLLTYGVIDEKTYNYLCGRRFYAGTSKDMTLEDLTSFLQVRRSGRVEIPATLEEPPPDSTNLREWFEQQLAEYSHFMERLTEAEAQTLSQCLGCDWADRKSVIPFLVRMSARLERANLPQKDRTLLCRKVRREVHEASWEEAQGRKSDGGYNKLGEILDQYTTRSGNPGKPKAPRSGAKKGSGAKTGSGAGAGAGSGSSAPARGSNKRSNGGYPCRHPECVRANARHMKRDCPKVLCFTCGKTGHMSFHCPAKKKESTNAAVQEPDELPPEPIWTFDANNTTKTVVDVTLCGSTRRLHCLVDTGSMRSFIFTRSHPALRDAVLRETTRRIHTQMGEPIEVVGEADVSITFAKGLEELKVAVAVVNDRHDRWQRQGWRPDLVLGVDIARLFFARFGTRLRYKVEDTVGMIKSSAVAAVLEGPDGGESWYDTSTVEAFTPAVKVPATDSKEREMAFGDVEVELLGLGDATEVTPHDNPLAMDEADLDEPLSHYKETRMHRVACVLDNAKEGGTRGGLRQLAGQPIPAFEEAVPAAVCAPITSDEVKPIAEVMEALDKRLLEDVMVEELDNQPTKQPGYIVRLRETTKREDLPRMAGTSRPYNPTKMAAARETLQYMVDKNMLEVVEHPSAVENLALSRVFFLQKSSGALRLTVDYRSVNELVVPPMPAELLREDQLRATIKAAGAKLFTAMDAYLFFNQIELAEESRPLFAFMWEQKIYQPTRLPTGSNHSPAVAQHLVRKALGPLYGTKVVVLIDDLLVMAATPQEMVATTNEVLQRLRRYGIRLRRSKTVWAVPEVKYIGRIYDGEKVRADPDKIRALVKMKAPRNKKEVMTFLGMVQYQESHVPGLSVVAAPLNKLRSKHARFKWTETEEAAFRAVLGILAVDCVQHHPDFGNGANPFVLYTDASDNGIGAVLTQQQGARDVILAYWSEALKHGRLAYDMTRKEAFALVTALRRFGGYASSRPGLICRTDSRNVTYIVTKANDEPMLARWAMRVAKSGAKIQFLAGKHNVLADACSRILQDSSLMNDAPEWLRRRRVQEEMARQLGVDPALVPNVMVEMARRPERLQAYRSLLRGATQHDDVEQLTRQAARLRDGCVGGSADVVEATTTAATIDDEEKGEDTAASPDVLQYPSAKQLVAAQQQDEYLRGVRAQLRSTRTVRDERGRVWSRATDGVLLVATTRHPRPRMYVPPIHRRAYMVAAHGSHRKRTKTMNMLSEVWWPKQGDDVADFISACHACQVSRGPNPRHGIIQFFDVPAVPFRSIVADVLGPLEKVTRADGRQAAYILMIVDRFTRYLVAEPIADQREPTVAEAIIRCVFMRFGRAAHIHTDRANNFAGQLSQQLHQLSGVRHHISVSYDARPQGLCERRNAVMKNMLTALSFDDTHGDKCWADSVASVTAFINAQPIAGLGLSPSYLLMGYQARPFLTASATSDARSVRIRHAYLLDYLAASGAVKEWRRAWKRAMEEMRSMAKDRHSTRDHRLDQQRNKGRSDPVYKVGSRCYLECLYTHALGARCDGPYKVIECHPRRNFTLQLESDPRVIKRNVGIRRMKPCVSPVAAPAAAKETTAGSATRQVAAGSTSTANVQCLRCERTSPAPQGTDATKLWVCDHCRTLDTVDRPAITEYKVSSNQVRIKWRLYGQQRGRLYLLAQLPTDLKGLDTSQLERRTSSILRREVNKLQG